MNRWWNDPVLVTRWVPIATMLLLEWANIQQLWRMWTTHTSAGQSLIGWLSVGLALLLWLNFYRVTKARIAMMATISGLVFNTSVWMTVIYWRYLV